MQIKKKRYYIHGDLSDKNKGTYFCHLCDKFHNFEHFVNNCHHDITKHLSKYSHDKKYHAPRYAMKAHTDINGDFMCRDKSAPNLFKDKITIKVKGVNHESHR